jgi:hypothetical protein
VEKKDAALDYPVFGYYISTRHNRVPTLYQTVIYKDKEGKI